MQNHDAPAAFAFTDRSDWSNWPYDLDFTSFAPTVSPRADIMQSKTSNAPDFHSATISRESISEETSNPRSTSTKELTSLLLDSDEIWAKLSQISDVRVSPPESIDAFLNTMSAKITTRHVLESFFVLAQRLISLYPAAISYSLSSNSTKGSTSNLANCTNHIDLVGGLKEVEDGVLQQGTFSGLDVALTNLLIACHNRQLDILDRLFLLVTSCTRVTLANRREPDFDVSETRVGSFVPERTAAVLMQMALLKHLVAALTNRVTLFGKAISVWTEKFAQMGLESSILKLQHEALTKRQDTKAIQVGLVEDFLLKFDFNRE